MKEVVSKVSGRGVGMDVVHSVINEVRGKIRSSTKLGEGSSFELQLPLTLSVLRSLLTEINSGKGTIGQLLKSPDLYNNLNDFTKSMNQVTGEVEATMVKIACSDAPEGRESWTMDLIAGRLVELGQRPPDLPDHEFEVACACGRRRNRDRGFPYSHDGDLNKLARLMTEFRT